MKENKEIINGWKYSKIGKYHKLTNLRAQQTLLKKENTKNIILY